MLITVPLTTWSVLNLIESHACSTAISPPERVATTTPHKLRFWRRQRSSEKRETDETETSARQHHAFDGNVGHARALAPDTRQRTQHNRGGKADTHLNITVTLVLLFAAARLTPLG